MGTKDRAPAQGVRWLEVVLVLLLAASAQYEVWVAPLFEGSIPGPRGLNSILLLLVCLPLLWRRRYPVLVFVVVLTAVGLQSLVEADAGVVNRTDQGSMQGWIAALVAFYSLAAYASPRRAVVVGGLVGAGWIAVDLGRVLSGDISLSDTVPGWFMLAAAWGLGYALRARGMQVSALVARAARDERERELRAREAVAEERSRIARELHDVVAHSLSVVVVQAQAADRVLEGDQRSAREALAAIDATGRQALVEMRRLVGMLREDGEPSLGPQPGVEQLSALLEQVREAGLPVELVVEGSPRDLPPGVDLSAYRIVQEALTNTLKHAGPARARVVLRFAEQSMELEITDDGRGATSEAGGHGLAGMTERVALYGGELETGTSNGQGFRVLARLPL
jgi:signal transduction histidine kinase